MKNVYRIAIPLVVFMASVSLWVGSAHAEKQPYRHMLVLGASQPVSNADENRMSPIILYNWFMEDFPHDIYGQIGIVTTRVFGIFGMKNDTIFAGIQPQLNHNIYGANHAYQNNGTLDETRIFKGHNAGAEFFFKYNFIKEFSAMVSYYPGYYFYQKYKEEQGFPFDTEETLIDLPENHWEHTGLLELVVDNVSQKDLNRIKHGVLLKAKYMFTHRVGYGTFQDSMPDYASDITNTHKIYGYLGLYYNFPYDINFLVDVYGGFHKHIDRNNSDQIGSYTSQTAPMPGYFFGEFYHDRYAISRTQLGFPLLPFWGTRLQVGFNVLYMPENNKVIGVQDYDRKTYRSVSCQLSTKLGGVLPLMANYAYGMDAERYNDWDGTNKKGNHEICVIVVMAFGQR